MNLSILVAFDKNRLIGSNNSIPWHIKGDMKRVKLLTTGNTIIMGEKTYHSIGKPLPNRKNVILSDNKDFVVGGAIVVHSKEEALEVCKDDKEVFIFGGASIYDLFMDDVTRIHLTYINEEFEGDTYFPHLVLTNWQLKYCKKYDDVLEYYYSILVRKG